jgi:hypothetical protein
MRTIYALSILLPMLLAPGGAGAHNRAEPDCHRAMTVTLCEQRSPGRSVMSGRDRLFVRSLLRTRRTTYDNLPKHLDDGATRDLGLLLNGPVPASSFA